MAYSYPSASAPLGFGGRLRPTSVCRPQDRTARPVDQLDAQGMPKGNSSLHIASRTPRRKSRWARGRHISPSSSCTRGVGQEEDQQGVCRRCAPADIARRGGPRLFVTSESGQPAHHHPPGRAEPPLAARHRSLLCAHEHSPSWACGPERPTRASARAALRVGSGGRLEKEWSPACGDLPLRHWLIQAGYDDGQL